MIKLMPTQLHGELHIQPSKSYLHRGILCSALSHRRVRVWHINKSEDIKATLEGARALGLCDYQVAENYIDIFPSQGETKEQIDCRESGSTLRFLLPIALTMGKEFVFTGSQRLLSRPLTPYEDLCKKLGFVFDRTKQGVKVCGKLAAGRFTLPGNISSQFITGLLLALSGSGQSSIELEGKIESLPYIQITLDVLHWFGVECAMEGNLIHLQGGYTSVPKEITIPGDWSHAAFYAVCGALSGEITLKGLSMEDKQGDRQILSCLRDMGAQIHIDEDGVHFQKSVLHAADIDVRQFPDLVPVLSVAMSLSKGTSMIYNAGRLRIKECDRLSAMASELNNIGGEVEERKNELVILGRESLCGGNTHAHNDHRIAMSMAVASCYCQQPVTIDQDNCVNKSAPDFWQEWKALGGEYVRGQ